MNFVCPFCSNAIALTSATFYIKKVARWSSHQYGGTNDTEYNVEVHFFTCPVVECKKTSIKLKYVGTELPKDKDLISIYPISKAKVFPDYIPGQIRVDYEEASAIVHLSPKAAATLLRRCLQGMIRDFWKVTKNTLYDEISELEGKVTKTQWSVLDSIRKIGNIGAHPERDINLIIDVETGAAEKIIKAIELLIEKWYINRFEEENLLNDVIAISDAKAQEKKGK